MRIYKSYEYIRQMAKNTEPLLRYKYNQDFSQWKEKAKNKLNELLGLPFEKCEDMFSVLSESDCGDYKRIDFEFQSEKDYFVTASLLVPANHSMPLPCTICLQGHSTGMHISLGEVKFEDDESLIARGNDFAVRTVKEGFCAIAMEQRYMGKAGQSEKGKPACLSYDHSMPALLMARCAIGERVWDVQRLIDVIYKYFSEYIDTDNLICMGNSGGGTATFYASCLDERISFSIPSCAVCTYEKSIMAMYHCPCNYVPGIRKYFDMGDIGALMAPRKLIVVCGKEDEIFPLSGVKESYELIKNVYKMLGREDICTLIEGNGGHRFYPDDVWPVVHKYLKGN